MWPKTTAANCPTILRFRFNMATIDIVIPTYRGLDPEASSNLHLMIRESQCFCGNHAPWKCDRGKHSVRLLPHVRGSSVVHWSRNQMIALALYSQKQNDGRPPAEYFLLLDDDMLCQPHYLTRMLSYKKDIVTGIATVRRDPPRPNIRLWDPKKNFFITPLEWDWDSNRLMEIDAVGAAFMLVKRQVFERMGAAWLRCEFERQADKAKYPQMEHTIDAHWDTITEARQQRFLEATGPGSDWKKADQWWFQFIPDQQGTGEYGEDIGFCLKAKKLGYKIFADPQILPGHIGSYGYSIADYRDWVQQGKDLGEIPESVAANDVGLSADRALKVAAE